MIELLRVTIPMFAWIALFSAVYGLHGVTCAARWSQIDVGGASLFRLALTAAFLLALLAQSILLVALYASRLRSASPFIFDVSVILAVAALAATGWSLFPTLVLSACV
jgi:hypothetical protein